MRAPLEVLPWEKRDREEEEKQGKERLQVGPGRVSSVDLPRESGRWLREESWAAGGAGAGPAAAALGCSYCCCFSVSLKWK